MEKETIKKITVCDDSVVLIKTNRRTYERTLKKNISDNYFFQFKKQEFTMNDIKRYNYEIA